MYADPTSYPSALETFWPQHAAFPFEEAVRIRERASAPLVDAEEPLTEQDARIAVELAEMDAFAETVWERCEGNPAVLPLTGLEPHELAVLSMILLEQGETDRSYEALEAAAAHPGFSASLGYGGLIEDVIDTCLLLGNDLERPLQSAGRAAVRSALLGIRHDTVRILGAISEAFAAAGELDRGLSALARLVLADPLDDLALERLASTLELTNELALVEAAETRAAELSALRGFVDAPSGHPRRARGSKGLGVQARSLVEATLGCPWHGGRYPALTDLTLEIVPEMSALLHAVGGEAAHAPWFGPDLGLCKVQDDVIIGGLMDVGPEPMVDLLEQAAARRSRLGSVLTELAEQEAEALDSLIGDIVRCSPSRAVRAWHGWEVLYGTLLLGEQAAEPTALRSEVMELFGWDELTRRTVAELLELPFVGFLTRADEHAEPWRGRLELLKTLAGGRLRALASTALWSVSAEGVMCSNTRPLNDLFD